MHRTHCYLLLSVASFKTPPSHLQHSCPPFLPPLTRIHPPVFCCLQRLSLLYTSSFFFGILLIFICSVWFCIVCLSPVSRQWFYPMVGDIMLFYHRVEPRTGCWRVSASVRQSIPSSHKPLGGGAAGVLGSAWFWCCSWWCF